jgi:hypothetical protein
MFKAIVDDKVTRIAAIELADLLEDLSKAFSKGIQVLTIQNSPLDSLAIQLDPVGKIIINILTVPDYNSCHYRVRYLPAIEEFYYKNRTKFIDDLNKLRKKQIKKNLASLPEKNLQQREQIIAQLKRTNFSANITIKKIPANKKSKEGKSCAFEIKTSFSTIVVKIQIPYYYISYPIGYNPNSTTMSEDYNQRFKEIQESYNPSFETVEDLVNNLSKHIRLLLIEEVRIKQTLNSQRPQDSLTKSSDGVEEERNRNPFSKSSSITEVGYFKKKSEPESKLQPTPQQPAGSQPEEHYTFGTRPH